MTCHALNGGLKKIPFVQGLKGGIRKEVFSSIDRARQGRGDVPRTKAGVLKRLLPSIDAKQGPNKGLNPARRVPKGVRNP